LYVEALIVNGLNGQTTVKTLRRIIMGVGKTMYRIDYDNEGVEKKKLETNISDYQSFYNKTGEVIAKGWFVDNYHIVLSQKSMGYTQQVNGSESQERAVLFAEVEGGTPAQRYNAMLQLGYKQCKICSGSGQIRCSVCGGSGKIEIACDICGGKGITGFKLDAFGNGTFLNCLTCGGTGRVKANCQTCYGAGKVDCTACNATGWEGLKEKMWK